jgi:hypothetical protein
MSYRKKAIELAKKIVREKVNQCQWCGKLPDRPGFLQGAHIMSVRFNATAADPENIMCLCYYCHLYRWHKNPFESVDWFKSKWPGRYEKLNAKAQKITKYKESDWQGIYDDLLLIQ